MRKIKRTLMIVTGLAALVLVVSTCDDTLDVFQAYSLVSNKVKKNNYS